MATTATQSMPAKAQAALYDYEVIVIGAGVSGIYQIKRTASYDGLLLSKAQSWITGYNSNLEGHEYGHTRYNIFATGGAEYAKHLRAAAANDHRGIDFSRQESRRSG